MCAIVCIIYYKQHRTVIFFVLSTRQSPIIAHVCIMESSEQFTQLDHNNMTASVSDLQNSANESLPLNS